MIMVPYFKKQQNYLDVTKDYLRDCKDSKSKTKKENEKKGQS